jgi:hypothetical protein
MTIAAGLPLEMADRRLRRLPLGANRPAGWIGRQMARDFETGFVGHLDRLVSELFNDDIYGRDRLILSSMAKDVGVRDLPWPALSAGDRTSGPLDVAGANRSRCSEAPSADRWTRSPAVARQRARLSRLYAASGARRWD